MTEFIKISSDMVQYSIENGKKANEAFASLLLNPYVTWAKFILTDDEPNGNKVRIPKEEFSNLVDSGIYMPIKMEIGKVGGHKASVPIGVITHLQEVKNRVEGLAALWKSERAEDINLLEMLKENDEPLNVSWEIGFTETAESEKYEGTKNLLNTVLKAATIVETPAYKGRTPILALAELIEQEKTNMDELQEKIDTLENSLSELQEEREELLGKLDGSSATIDELTSELEDLREFKSNIEQKQEREEKLSLIKEKFEEAGIKKDEEYFEENAETLLSLEESSLDFLIQEALAFGKSLQEDEAEDEDELEDEEAGQAPPLFGEDEEIDTSSLAHFLKFGNKDE